MAFRMDIKSKKRVEFLNITTRVKHVVKDANIKQGICSIYVPHTTAGITINESADPAVPVDIISQLEQLVPLHGNYKHAEGNSDAHIKTLLTGNNVTIPIIEGQLALGTWQAIFFCEYDGPRNRKAQIMIISGN